MARRALRGEHGGPPMLQIIITGTGVLPAVCVLKTRIIHKLKETVRPAPAREKQVRVVGGLRRRGCACARGGSAFAMS